MLLESFGLLGPCWHLAGFGLACCVRVNIRYYPPAFGLHFVQIAMARGDAEMHGPRPQAVQVDQSDAQLTDFEIFTKHYGDVKSWGDLWIDVGFLVELML